MGYNKYYTIPNSFMFYYDYLKTFFRLFDFGKNSGYFFFIFKWFYYIKIIQEFFQLKIDYSLTNLLVYLI